jgi:hypothetical protein
MLLEADKVGRLQLFGEASCDLVRTVEQSFGTMLTEDELVHAATIGALAHTITAKLEHPVSPQCLTAVTFYKLRRAFVGLFDIAPSKICPTTSLRVLMPWKTRKKQWHKVQDHLNYVLPQLTWPLWLLVLWLSLTALTLYFLFDSEMLRTLGSASVLVGIIGVISVLGPCRRNPQPAGADFSSKLRNIWRPCEAHVGAPLRKDSEEAWHIFGKRSDAIGIAVDHC